MKRIVSLVLVTAIIFLFTSCSGTASGNKSKPLSDVKKNPVATIEMKTGEKIVIELYPKSAPQTVMNFIHLANSGFYNGLTFHRIAAGFVVQGGDPKGDGTGGPGYSIKGEFSANGVDNKISHTKGTLSMARSPAGYDTAGSQFFIMLADRTDLDGQYAAFGKVTKGFDVCEAMAKLEIVSSTVGVEDTPVHPPLIKSITVETYGYDYPEPDKITK